MRTLITLALSLPAFLSGCGGEAGAHPAPQQAVPFDELQRVVLRWMECTECWDGELNDLLALGEQTHPVLERALTEGLTDKREAVLFGRLEDAYDDLVRYANTQPQALTLVPREAYVEMEFERYDLLYRSRSARALAAFGTEEAREILGRALEALQQSRLPNDAVLRSLIESF